MFASEFQENVENVSHGTDTSKHRLCRNNHPYEKISNMEIYLDNVITLQC